jgi:hypothetical protein
MTSDRLLNKLTVVTGNECQSVDVDQLSAASDMIPPLTQLNLISSSTPTTTIVSRCSVVMDIYGCCCCCCLRRLWCSNCPVGVRRPEVSGDLGAPLLNLTVRHFSSTEEGSDTNHPFIFQRFERRIISNTFAACIVVTTPSADAIHC